MGTELRRSDVKLGRRETASHTDLNFTRSQGFNIETWARTSNTEDSWKILFGRRGSAGGTLIKAGHWQGEMGFAVRTSTGQGAEMWYGWEAGHQAINDGQWHHWVFFLNSTHIGMWLDGQLVLNEPHNLTGGDFSASTPFYVLRETAEPDRWLTGQGSSGQHDHVLRRLTLPDRERRGDQILFCRKPKGRHTCTWRKCRCAQERHAVLSARRQCLDRLSTSLGSTSLTTNTSGGLVAELRYKACPLRCASGVLREGETRYSSGATPTTHQFTGQRNESGIDLYFYNARWMESYSFRGNI